MDDFINFRKLITPYIIKVLFWISSALCFIAGVVLIASSFGAYSSGAATFLIGLCIALLGPIFSRIVCETIYAIFQIHEINPSVKPTQGIQKRGSKSSNK